MIMVADCSALVVLSVCGSLNLLEHLFTSVVVKEKSLIVEVCAIASANRAIGYLTKS